VCVCESEYASVLMSNYSNIFLFNPLSRSTEKEKSIFE